MFYNNPSNHKLPICLAIYGCSSLERVSDFINRNPRYTDALGCYFTSDHLAGQYAFEQVKLDRKGYDTRRLIKYLSFLSDAGADFSFESALSYADEYVNQFTADFGHDEEGDATFRINAQCFRLNRYDCQALWDRVRTSKVILKCISRENPEDDEDDPGQIDDEIVGFRLTFALLDSQKEEFAALHQYVTLDEGNISVEEFIDYSFTEYPNFHDESHTMMLLMKDIAVCNREQCIAKVCQFFSENSIELPECGKDERQRSFDIDFFQTSASAGVGSKP